MENLRFVKKIAVLGAVVFMLMGVMDLMGGDKMGVVINLVIGGAWGMFHWWVSGIGEEGV
jgi:hypothetical protein